MSGPRPMCAGCGTVEVGILAPLCAPCREVVFADSAESPARTGTVADYPDCDLVRRALRNAGLNAACRLPRWAHVKAVFGLGSTYAAQLCRRFDLDPDELVGRLPEGQSDEE